MSKEKEHESMFVRDGVGDSHDGRGELKRRKFIKKNRSFDIGAVAVGVCAGFRKELAQAITLIESTNEQDQKNAQILLQKLLKQKPGSIRIGVSGVPGSGKSTFIESFGLMLCELGHKVAVLAIDPSSAVTGGSVLGDKTRMEHLSNHPNAFVRPSPTSGTLGGVHRKTRETMLICEAAGYDVILVETVGVGQSEIAVRNMVDFFGLLVLTGAGDDLQGMKKGIMESTDLIIVHKADGENVRSAKRTVREYKRILHHLQPATPGWQATALPVSSIEGNGHKKVWENMTAFVEATKGSGFWETRRNHQLEDWFRDMLRDALIENFFRRAGRKAQVAGLKEDILAGRITVGQAVEGMLGEDG
jgi:LAO/AO transport system kinase